MRVSGVKISAGLLAFVATAPAALAQDFKSKCEALAQSAASALPGAGRITEAAFVAGGPVTMPPPAPPGTNAPARDHCMVRGKINERTGVADPIFSAIDTVSYLDQLGARYGNDTVGFARLFLVPCMNHCAGGPATDTFDALGALDAWVEKGTAPESIIATARKTPDVAWPGRTRPLCAHPKVATYKGSGDIEIAASFDCR